MDMLFSGLPERTALQRQLRVHEYRTDPCVLTSGFVALRQLWDVVGELGQDGLEQKGH